MTAAGTKVTVDDGKINVTVDGKVETFRIDPLPESLMTWFLEGRKEGHASLLEGKGPGPLFSRHLPVVATTGGKGPFAQRLAHKGVGFLPRQSRLHDTITQLEEMVARTRSETGNVSLRERLDAVSGFLQEPEGPDPRLLGSLEIFTGGTFNNLSQNPFASLLFTDPGPGYNSFQLDCVVEIIEPPDQRFRFLQLARSLFEHDPFHIAQPGFRCAYLFWIVGSHDKTPHPVDGHRARHRL